MASGFFEKTDTERTDPRITIALSGSPDHPPQPITCTIDTGFTGFLQVPEDISKTYNLSSHASLNVEYAGGDVVSRPVCMGIAEIDCVRMKGVVMLGETNSHPLLGMRFLSIFRMKLVVAPTIGLLELARIDAHMAG